MSIPKIEYTKPIRELLQKHPWPWEMKEQCEDKSYQIYVWDIIDAKGHYIFTISSQEAGIAFLGLVEQYTRSFLRTMGPVEVSDTVLSSLEPSPKKELLQDLEEAKLIRNDLIRVLAESELSTGEGDLAYWLDNYQKQSLRNLINSYHYFGIQVGFKLMEKLNKV